MVFGGGVETAQDAGKTQQKVIVAAAARYGAQVIEQDHQAAEDEQGEHQDRHPTRAFLDVLGNRWGVSGGCGDAVFVELRST